MRDQTRTVIGIGILLCVVASAIPGPVDARLRMPQPGRCADDQITTIPNFDRPLLGSDAAAWAKYTRKIASHDKGFSFSEASKSPTNQLVFTPHRSLCSVAGDRAAGPNKDGQLIGYLQYVGAHPPDHELNSYKLAPGEIGFLVVVRSKSRDAAKQDVTLWLLSSTGEKLVAHPYLVCHADRHASPGDPTKRRADWGITDSMCDAARQSPPWLSTWASRHVGYVHVHRDTLHNEQPWFSCQEGCCHIVEDLKRAGGAGPSPSSTRPTSP
jgi:hypothetical protein